MTRHDVTSIDEMCEFIRSTTANNCYNSIRDGRRLLLTGLALSMQWSDRVSNSHSCPINGTTNWDCDDTLPTGYPGFNGRIALRFDRSPTGFSTDVLHGSCAHGGSGGWRPSVKVWKDVSRRATDANLPGHYTEYELRIYVEDFPKLARHMEQLKTMHLLQFPDKPFLLLRDYVWIDPLQQALDDQLESIGNGSLTEHRDAFDRLLAGTGHSWAEKLKFLSKKVDSTV
jgi:hypothetical protein